MVSAGLPFSEDRAAIPTGPPRIGRAVVFGAPFVVEEAQLVFVLPQLYSVVTKTVE